MVIVALLQSNSSRTRQFWQKSSYLLPKLTYASGFWLKHKLLDHLLRSFGAPNREPIWRDVSIFHKIVLPCQIYQHSITDHEVFDLRAGMCHDGGSYSPPTPWRGAGEEGRRAPAALLKEDGPAQPESTRSAAFIQFATSWGKIG